MKVGVIGSGYVGLVTGTCLAHIGHQVICVDNDAEKIAVLRRGKTPIYEPGLENLLKRLQKNGRLSFTTQIKEAVRSAEILFICVNTPPKENGEADLSAVENVSREIALNLKEYRLIVEKSTVPVQTGEWIYKTIKSIQSDEGLFDVASNPEFLREGSAVQDFLKPDRIILGASSPKAERMLRELYKPIKARVVVTDIKSAELIKHASNSFLAAKISFINAVAKICDASGADVENVALGMGLDPRIGPHFLKAGIGFGGFCFPKDLSAFYSMSEKLGVPFHLLKEALQINQEQKAYFVRKVESHLWNLKGKTLAVWGIAFKADTDDIRFAPSLDIIAMLQAQGAHIRAYDPQAMARAREVLPGVSWAKDPYAAAKGADALLLITEWKEFLQADFKKVKSLMTQPVIFDGRNVLDPKAILKLGFQYFAIGRQTESRVGALV